MIARASAQERARLNATFASLCAIRSPTGEERAIADHVAGLLRDELGLEVLEDDSAPLAGTGAGNLLAHLPGTTDRSVLLCTHLDTVGVPDGLAVEPVLQDGGWVSAGETILGADNKAAVAVALEVARRWASPDAPAPRVGLELLFTMGEEAALAGSKAFDVSLLRSDLGYVFDQASPIGEVVIGSPTAYQLQATFHGRAAHAGLRPEDGRSALLAAAHAITKVPFGRIDEHSTTNVGWVRGGGPGTNVVAEHAAFAAEVRSHDDARAEQLVGEMVDAIHDAANDPLCACDVDVDVQRVFGGYRHPASHPAVANAEAALSALGYTPRRVLSGGGTDANVLEAAGFPCTNLANGTERNHQTDERVSVAALEGMLDVALVLLDGLA